jgi:hypothetical protein
MPKQAPYGISVIAAKMDGPDLPAPEGMILGIAAQMYTSVVYGLIC